MAIRLDVTVIMLSSVLVIGLLLASQSPNKTPTSEKLRGSTRSVHDMYQNWNICKSTADCEAFKGECNQLFAINKQFDKTAHELLVSEHVSCLSTPPCCWPNNFKIDCIDRKCELLSGQ